MKIIYDIRNKGLDLSKKVYRCTNCKEPFNWNANSRWFGSWNDMENNRHEKIKYFCSNSCYNELK